MASVENDDTSSAKITEDIDKLTLTKDDNQSEEKIKNIGDDDKSHNSEDSKGAKLDNEQQKDDEFKPHLTGFEIRELYKIALNFYKGNLCILLFIPVYNSLIFIISCMLDKFFIYFLKPSYICHKFIPVIFKRNKNN